MSLNTTYTKLASIITLWLLLIVSLIVFSLFNQQITQTKNQLQSATKNALALLSINFVPSSQLITLETIKKLEKQLKLNTNINKITVFNKNKKDVFNYVKNNTTPSIPSLSNWQESTQYKGTQLTVLKAIRSEGETYGYIYSQTDASAIQQIYRDYYKIIAVILISTLITFLILRGLLKAIASKKIMALHRYLKNTLADEHKKVETVDKELSPVINLINDIKNTIKANRRELEEQKTAFNSHLLVTITDEKGMITSVNDKLLAINGYSRDELIGQNHKILSSDYHQNSFFKVMYRTISRGRIWHGEICNQSKSKQIYWLDTTIAPLMDENNRPYGYIFVSTDITQQKKYEEALVKSNLKALDASKVKSEFLASMSHEIRTPLNGVIGMLEQLKNTPLNDEQYNKVGIAEESSNYLLSVISDILDYSKIEAGKLSLDAQPTNLIRCVDSCINSMSILAKNKSISLKTKIENINHQVFVFDEIRVKQILINLISNAIKFSSIGNVTVAVERLNDETDKQQIKFSVSDTGIGIEKDKIKSLFERFTQADSSITRKYGGTGLGLAICQQLLLLMDSKLEVSSTVGVGSIFSFVLTLEKSEQSVSLAHQLTDSKQLKLNNASILIVEDNKTNQLIVKSILERLGVDSITIAENGKEALDWVKKTKFDLIFMDCQMPVMDGYQASRFIRKYEKKSQQKITTPIVALTAYAMQGDRDICMLSGMNDYLEKPFVLLDIMEVLLKWIPNKCEVVHFQTNTIDRQETEQNNKKNVFELKQLKDRLMGDEELVKKVTKAFITDTESNIQQLEQEIKHNNVIDIKQLAHKIKGASALAGAPLLSESALVIEQCVKSKNVGPLNKHLQLLKNQFDKFNTNAREKLLSIS